jgi:ferric-dicitrate binding protein FerR (iron transport regulator)
MSSQDSIENLIRRYLEGDLEGDHRTEFENRLHEDPEAVDLLCQHALMDATLRLSIPAQNDTAYHLLEIQKRRAVRISLAAAAAIAMTSAFVLYRIMVPAPAHIGKIESAPGSLFSIQSKTPDAQNHDLDPGETLVVSQGTVEVTLPDGSRFIAEAPAHVTLHSEMKAHLSNGRAFFEIAKESVGFVVTTKDLEIVDLGTAFGVDDRAEFQPQIHVVEGKVRATAKSGRHESSLLVAGEAAAVGAAGTLRPIACQSSSFFQELPSGLPSIRFTFDSDTSEQAAVSGSIAELEGVQFIDESHLHEMISTEEGPFGSFLSFANNRSGVETTWGGIGGTTPRTISLWVRIPEKTEGGDILAWGLISGSRKMSDLQVIYSGDTRANLRLASGRRWLQTTQRLDTGNWHHVTFIIDSPASDDWPTVKCYVDGVLEPITPRIADEGEVAPLNTFETITDHPLSRPLTFGANSYWEKEHGFTGDIDEVVITAGILTEKEIQELANPS